MDERHPHRMALQLVDHRSLILPDRIRKLSQQDHCSAALLSAQCRLVEASICTIKRCLPVATAGTASVQESQPLETDAFPGESFYFVAREGNETRQQHRSMNPERCCERPAGMRIPCRWTYQF